MKLTGNSVSIASVKDYKYQIEIETEESVELEGCRFYPGDIVCADHLPKVPDGYILERHFDDPEWYFVRRGKD